MDNGIKKDCEYGNEELNGDDLQSSETTSSSKDNASLYENGIFGVATDCEGENAENAKSSEYKADEEETAICLRNEKHIETAKKIGFYSLIVFILLSLLFGALSLYNIWQNRLNILFLGIAVLMYGIQNLMIRLAVNKCKCANCSASKKRLESIIIICFAAFVISVALSITLTFFDMA